MKVKLAALAAALALSIPALAAAPQTELKRNLPVRAFLAGAALVSGGAAPALVAWFMYENDRDKRAEGGHK